MVLLRLPRKGESRRRLSLKAADARPKERSWPQRVGWMVLIWAASVMVLGIVAALFRVLMALAGLTAEATEPLAKRLVLSGLGALLGPAGRP
jgi:Protein of unknown function (DUF2474)